MTVGKTHGSWVNPTDRTYIPRIRRRLLIIVKTSNIIIKKSFEKELKRLLNEQKIEVNKKYFPQETIPLGHPSS